MEMNTRLQVEHPVTEMITGLDLVEWQIRVAQGEKLPKQNDIQLKGHAVEARLYAEDPANDFLPSIGKLQNFDTDILTDTENLKQRIDTGVETGASISIHYDPMIAKVIGYSRHERKLAISSLKEALIETDIVGLKTNIYFLINCLKHFDFKNEALSTGFIPENQNILLGPNIENRDEFYAFAALRIEHEKNKKEDMSPFAKRDGWRNNLSNRHQYEFASEDGKKTVDILSLTDDIFTVSINSGSPKSFELYTYKQLLVNEHGNDFEDSLNYPERWACEILHDHIFIRRQGFVKKVCLPSFDNNSLTNSSNALTASMPGKIIAVNTKAGDSVKAGDPLIVMEAMKMEMTLEAPRDGVVAEVNFEAGSLVSDGEVLLTLEEESE